MRLASQIVSLLLMGIVASCVSSPPEPAGALSEAPAIVILQYPDYPMTGRGSQFAGGLVAALWRDGRMIRPASPDAVGKSYVAGVVSPAQRDAFFAFLSSSAAVRAPEGGGIPVDGAAQSITVRRDGEASMWTRVLPDIQSAWREVESRLLALPIHGSRPVAWAAVRMFQTACEAPHLFREKFFTASSFAEAVNHFVMLGEDAAVQELRGLGANNGPNYQHGFSIHERIGWMCRVLFEAKAGEPLRPPLFGVLSQLPHETMPLKSWPLFPVALSGSTYFVLSEGYTVGGRPEHATIYIEYCRHSGVFRQKPVTVPTKAQALRDAAALRQSIAGKAIKWTESDGTMDEGNEGRVWNFIQKQAENIRCGLTEP